MLVAAGVVPCPPLLVPELAVGAAAELDGLRDGCAEVLAGLATAAPDLLAVVGGARDGEWRGRSFSAYGADVAVSADTDLPLSLLAARWLLDRVGWSAAWECVEVDAGSEPAGCAELGRRLAARADRVALLAVGDGSARRAPSAPGSFDPRAERFDAAVAGAFAAADPAALLRLDPALAEQLLAGGRAAWQVLAGAAAYRRWHGQVHWAGAPYGVGYLAALWRGGEEPGGRRRNRPV